MKTKKLTADELKALKIEQGRKMGLKNREVCIDGTNIRNLTAKTYTTNKSGHKGVYYDKERGKWAACIQFKGIKYRLGRYDNIQDAINARESAEQEFFEKFLNQRKNGEI